MNGAGHRSDEGGVEAAILEQRMDALGLLERAHAPFGRAGEGALLVAEQLGTPGMAALVSESL